MTLSSYICACVPHPVKPSIHTEVSITNRKGLVLSRLSRREEAIVALVESARGFPYNWSLWTKLAELLDGEEEVGNPDQAEAHGSSLY